ncbi:MAG: tRNA-dependent cyclodipeptide synthase [Cyanobacteria bacterium P01_H01_bin.35]
MKESSSNYLVETKQVYTTSTKVLEKDYIDCILAINLDSDKFTAEKINATIDWLETKFKRCLILIADSLYELSLQMINPEWEQQQATLLTDSKSQKILQILSEKIQFKKPDNFEIVLSSVVQKYSGYEEYRKNLELIYKKESNFKSSVEKFSEGFLHSKQIPSSAKNLEMTCNYVLEDLAIIACISQRGYKALVYPGYLPLFIEIANGEHPELILQLQELVYYEISLRSSGN